MAGLIIGDPVTLTQALASQRIIPGDTLLLRGMTYSGNFTVPFSGTLAEPITIKNYLDEHVIMDGQLTVSGNHVKIIGLESMNSVQRNRSVGIGTEGFVLLGDYIEIVNCIIHDHDQGVSAGASKTGGVYYGNVIYHNGWDDNNGHGMYLQNNAGNLKTIKRNIIFDNFAYGIHAWGSTGDVSDFVMDGNTCFENGAPRAILQDNILNGNQNTFTSPKIFNNLTYNKEGQIGSGTLAIGYGTGNQALDVDVHDNYLVNDGVALFFKDATITRFDGNTIIGLLTGAELGDNTQLENYPLTGSHIVLTDNEYDPRLAQLTIYNWSLADVASVDVSSIFGVGDTIHAKNVQNYFVDIQELTVAGDGTITVNMQAINRTVATPVGWTAPATTFPRFGAFRLEKAA